ncbi:hypothetical protein [Desulfitobacterium sp.]|uniref:hypothetical protein n=1 Tax=Desulfitobacterium sp. TaxID=49981 RepID=UPI002C7B1A89|nr:hypothetical protein [Desulfitobacterium sp.]HVJ50267.1 hypothetical protein [Desulfitobacterium sp.]
MKRYIIGKFIGNNDHKKYSKLIDKFNDDARNVKWFKHFNGSLLCIRSAGGVSKIPTILEQVLDLNQLGSFSKYERILVISDRDEVGTEQKFITDLSVKFKNFNVVFSSYIEHNSWNKATYSDVLKEESQEVSRVEFLPLIIPFEETGAIETFLLDGLCENSEKEDELKTDKIIIEQCRTFIDNINCNEKYLCHRREKTKAKFQTVFVVRTPADDFNQRQSLLRSVPWERYETVQNGFKQFSRLSEEI